MEETDHISCADYVAAVLSAHKQGKINALAEYVVLYDRHHGETHRQFIERCAELDYDDGPDAWAFSLADLNTAGQVS